MLPDRRDGEGTLALTGDVMLRRLVKVILHGHAPSYPWGDSLPLEL